MGIRNGLLLISAAVLVLSGCGAPTPTPGTSSESPGTTSSSPDDSAATGAGTVSSTAPTPLIDLDCGDLAAVLTGTRYVDAPLRDGGTVLADQYDSFALNLHDVIRNAGGVACEWSQGGTWYVPKGDSFALNVDWYGVAIHIIPHGKVAFDDGLLSTELCGEGSLNSRGNVCRRVVTVGDTLVEFVVGTHDRYETYRAVWNSVEALVAAATIEPAPVDRAPGTLVPPHGCDAVVPADLVARLLGGADGVYADYASSTQDMSTATAYTEHISCSWNREGSTTFFTVKVYPGGGWLAEPGWASYPGEAITVPGMRDRDRAIQHCFTWPDGNRETWCTVGVLADGTWTAVKVSALDPATASAASVELAAAVLAHRS